MDHSELYELINGPRTLPHSRGYASVHGGTYNFPADPVASNNTLPVAQGDHSGFHQVAVVAMCSQPNCKFTNCATGNEETNACGESSEYHQQPIQEHSEIVYELAGILTHNTPATMVSVVIDAHVDAANKNKKRELAVDQGTTPVNPTEFVKNQLPHHTYKKIHEQRLL